MVHHQTLLMQTTTIDIHCHNNCYTKLLNQLRQRLVVK